MLMCRRMHRRKFFSCCQPAAERANQKKRNRAEILTINMGLTLSSLVLSRLAARRQPRLAARSAARRLAARRQPRLAGLAAPAAPRLAAPRLAALAVPRLATHLCLDPLQSSLDMEGELQQMVRLILQFAELDLHSTYATFFKAETRAGFRSFLRFTDGVTDLGDERGFLSAALASMPAEQRYECSMEQVHDLAHAFRTGERVVPRCPVLIVSRATIKSNRAFIRKLPMHKLRGDDVNVLDCILRYECASIVYREIIATLRIDWADRAQLDALCESMITASLLRPDSARIKMFGVAKFSNDGIVAADVVVQLLRSFRSFALESAMPPAALNDALMDVFSHDIEELTMLVATCANEAMIDYLMLEFPGLISLPQLLACVCTRVTDETVTTRVYGMLHDFEVILSAVQLTEAEMCEIVEMPKHGVEIMKYCAGAGYPFHVRNILRVLARPIDARQWKILTSRNNFRKLNTMLVPQLDECRGDIFELTGLRFAEFLCVTRTWGFHVDEDGNVHEVSCPAFRVYRDVRYNGAQSGAECRCVDVHLSREELLEKTSAGLPLVQCALENGHGVITGFSLIDRGTVAVSELLDMFAGKRREYEELTYRGDPGRRYAIGTEMGFICVLLARFTRTRDVTAGDIKRMSDALFHFEYNRTYNRKMADTNGGRELHAAISNWRAKVEWVSRHGAAE